MFKSSKLSLRFTSEFLTIFRVFTYPMRGTCHIRLNHFIIIEVVGETVSHAFLH